MHPGIEASAFAFGYGPTSEEQLSRPDIGFCREMLVIVIGCCFCVGQPLSAVISCS